MSLRKLASAVAVAGALLGGAFLFRPLARARGKIGPDCTLKGKKLYGRVQVVTAFPDLKVRVVDVFPDLEVQKVDRFPEKCGMWTMVDKLPDLKIQLVDVFPDLKIRHVKVFPGPR